MNEQPRRALRELVARHGASVVEDPRRGEALLRDHSAQHRREVAALASALEEGVPRELLAAPAATPRGVLLARLARRLADHHALAEDAARWSVNSWALALGVVSEEQLAQLEREAAADAGGHQDPATGNDPTARTASPPSSVNRSTTHAVAAATTLVVSPAGGDYASIAEAVRRAADGTRILVRPGVYDEAITLDKEIELVGDGPAERIVVRGDRASCLHSLAARARVAGLTLRAEPDAGGEGFFAVEVARGELLLEDCDISSRALSCVAVHGEESAPVIRRCRIHDGADSGLYFFDGAGGTLEDCEVYANRNVCVAVTSRARPVIKRTSIHDGENAGVAVWGEAELTLEECEVYANRLAGVGVNDAGRVRARACRIREGRNTGVFVHRRGDATLEGCELYGHREAEVAVETEGQLTALRCRVRGGRGNGFFIRFGGQALIQECEVSGNAADGVAVVAAGSLAAVLNCRVNANEGAGLRLAEGALARVNDSDLTGNRLGPWATEEGTHLEGGGNAE